jgi:hypothetical protein
VTLPAKYSGRGRLPRQSGLAQLALLATIVTHRVSIQPFHLRGGTAVFNPAPTPSRASNSSALTPLIPAAGLCGPSPRRHNLGSCPRPSTFIFHWLRTIRQIPQWQHDDTARLHPPPADATADFLGSVAPAGRGDARIFDHHCYRVEGGEYIQIAPCSRSSAFCFFSPFMKKRGPLAPTFHFTNLFSLMPIRTNVATRHVIVVATRHVIVVATRHVIVVATRHYMYQV